MKIEYSSMAEALQAFLAKFHSHVMPSAVNESRNLLISSQKSKHSSHEPDGRTVFLHMADSFEKVITPTFKKMNDSLDTRVSSVTRCQEDAIREILKCIFKGNERFFRSTVFGVWKNIVPAEKRLRQTI